MFAIIATVLMMVSNILALFKGDRRANMGFSGMLAFGFAGFGCLCSSVLGKVFSGPISVTNIIILVATTGAVIAAVIATDAGFDNNKKKYIASSITFYVLMSVATYFFWT